MNRFTELLKQGIAQSPYKTDTFKEQSSGSNGICRLYNNVWGSVSDTHMVQHEDGYVITGSMIRQPELFDKFINAENWGVYSFKQATKIPTLADFFKMYQLSGQYGTQNGDAVYKLLQVMPTEN